MDFFLKPPITMKTQRLTETHCFDCFSGHLLTHHPIFEHIVKSDKHCFATTLIFIEESRYDLPRTIAGAHHLLFSLSMINDWSFVNLFGHSSTRNSLHIGWSYDSVECKYNLYCTIWDQKRHVCDELLLYSAKENEEISITIIVDKIKKKYVVQVNNLTILNWHYNHNKNHVVVRQQPKLDYFIPFHDAVSSNNNGGLILIQTIQ